METFESPVYTFETQSGPLQRNPWLKWLVIVAIWGFLGVVYTAPIYLEVRSEGMGHSVLKVFSWGILSWVAWAFLTPVMIWLARRFSLVAGAWKRSLPIHVLAFLLLSAVHSATATAVVLTIKPWDNMGNSPTTFWPRFLSRMKGSFAGDLLVYGAVIGVCYAIDYYRKYRERESLATQLEAQLAQAQLDSLRMQLHPHFLFNTLNGIVGLVRDNKNQAAVSMLVGLSDLLRHALEHSDQQEVELKEELGFIKLYLSIQQMRFSDRLRIDFDIDPTTLKALVPNLILQPLLENALHHGIGRSTEEGSIRVTSKKTNGSLSITISDNGAGLPVNWQLKSNTGIGLANTAARLQQLYGDNHRFDIHNRDEGGVEVELVMPFRKHEG
ncbi:MAG TPA: histidine kinase [Pyrinomonadaceae bacterium]|nr:histidine kinase [Pyrinomonadaceae bacterium]